MSRRSDRARQPARTPEQSTVPLVERAGGISRRSNTPSSLSTSSRRQGSFNASVPSDIELSEGNMLDETSTSPSQTPIVSVNQRSTPSVLHVAVQNGNGQRPVLVDEAFDNARLQNLLHQASILGHSFDRNLASGNPEATASLTDPDTSEGGNTGADVIGLNTNDADDARQDNRGAETAVAISLKRGNDQFVLDVISMSLATSPTVQDVLQRVKDGSDPNTRAINQQLEEMSPREIRVGTARKPVSFRILEQYAGDAAVGYRSLGTLEEAVDKPIPLEPCADCAETEDLRKFKAPPISSSTPVFILYCHCQAIPSNRVLVAGLPAASQVKAIPTSDRTIFEYLEIVMDPIILQLLNKHVLRHRNTHRAFSNIIQARLIQWLCNDIGVMYESGNNRSYKFPTPHGQYVSLDDVVLFFAEKTPANRVGARGSAIAPSTFGNHRSWHMRAYAALTKLAGKNITDESHKHSLDLVKQLVLTELTDLDTLQPGEHGSWDEFKSRVVMLEGLGNN